MSGLPLRFVHENVLVGHGEARAALYRVSTVSYPFMASADKREWLGRLARFAFAVEADFSLWRVNRAYPADRYVELPARVGHVAGAPRHDARAAMAATPGGVPGCGRAGAG
jgi:hypothetical protein